ncbi:DUF4190 domain-containing protein [Microbacteriaceae bacterium 4G12]
MPDAPHLSRAEEPMPPASEPALDPASEPEPVSEPSPDAQRNGLGLAALIVGIVALVGALVPIVNYGTGALALVGILLGVVALFRRDRRRGVAVAGTVVSGVALILSIVLAIVYSLAIAGLVEEAAPTATAPPLDTGETPSGEGAAADTLGTRGNPAPLGTTVEVDSAAGIVEWDVTLGAATLDADDIVAAEDRFTDPAPNGFQYAMVPVTVVYRGTETGTPWAELAIDFVSAAGTTHTSSDSFAVVPAPLTDVTELAPGSTGTGNVVVSVPTADVEKGTWTLSTTLGERVYFAAE